MKKILFIIVYLLSYSLLTSQSLTVFDVDTTNFPAMKAKMFVMDANGNQLSNLSPSDFTLKENGQPRTVTNLSCPIEKPVRQVSLAMSMDASLSMLFTALNPSIERAQITAGKIIELTTSPPSEIALLKCNNHAEILNDFTTNKSKLLSLITSFNTVGETNFPELLLNPNSGLLNIAKTGKFEKSAVLFTNGCSWKLEDSVLKQCIDTCLKYNIKFYAFIYPGCSNQENLIYSLQILTERTGGKLYNEIINDEEALKSAYLLRQQIQDGDYCSIEWESDNSCDNGLIDLEIKFNTLEINSIIQYKSTHNSLAGLTFRPGSVFFKNKLPNNIYDTTITITAVNSNFIISEIKSSNSDFTISPASFTLNTGESIDLNLRFKPQDSSYIFCKFDIINNTCKVNYFVSGGFKGVKPKKGTLKLTYPNGEEDFFAGGETFIKWEGISKSDNCVLEYSTDNGLTWKLITENALGLSYLWQNIPNSVSSQCLIRIKQNDINGGYDNKPKIEWAKTFGGSGYDFAYSIITTNDGGYLVIGEAFSNDLDIPKHGMSDWYIIKLDALGNIIWQQTYGGSSTERPQSVQETKDGGFIICGFSYSFWSYSYLHKGDADFWIIKIDHNGKLLWLKSFGGTDFDSAFSIKECKNGDYIVVGESWSNDGDITNHWLESDWWVLRLDTSGNIIWQHSYGGNSPDYGYQIKETKDENFIIVGETQSNMGDITENKGNIDCWIIKIDKNGKLIWQKTFGGDGWDAAFSFEETDDNGFIVGCFTYSIDGDVTFNHGLSEFWIVKLDSNANIIWQKTYGGSSNECLLSLTKTFDSSYIGVGLSKSTGGDVTENKGLTDLWIIKIDSVGNLIWQKSIGGSNDDIARSVDKTGDGGFIVAGETQSFDGDVTGFNGYKDYWVIKFSPDGTTLQEDISDNTFSIVSTSAESQDVDMGNCLLGSSKDTILTEFIHNTGSYKIRIDSVYFSGEDSSAFSLVPEFSQFEIKAGEYSGCQFQFKPFKSGLHLAQINIITQSDTLIQEITGIGYDPQLTIVSGFINFGEVELGSYNEIQDSALIRNISDMPVKINNVKQNDYGKSQFEILNGGGSFILQSNEERKISMKFKPVFGGRSTGQLEFEYEGVGSPAVAQLFGTGKGGIIRISNDSAKSGDNINFKVNLINAKPESIAAIAPNFELKLRFQNTILAPLDYFTAENINDSTYITVKGKFVNSNELANIRMIAGLGNVDETSVDIVDFSLFDDFGEKADYNFEYESGSFHLLGICYEGGARLINPKGETQLSISPNPNDGNLTVELNLLEKGASTLSVYNSSGELMIEKNLAGTTGKIDLNINTKEFANGLYFVSLQTPTIRKVEQLVVFK